MQCNVNMRFKNFLEEINGNHSKITFKKITPYVLPWLNIYKYLFN